MECYFVIVCGEGPQSARSASLSQPQLALEAINDGRRQAVQLSGHAPSALRADMMESISSMKMTLGCITPATANRVFTCIHTEQHHKQQQQ